MKCISRNLTLLVIISLSFFIICEEPESQQQKWQISKRTYKVVFPFKEPKTIEERFIFKHNDVVTYMNWVRTKENIKWAKAFAETYLNPSFSNVKTFLELSFNSELVPYIPREDISTYQMSEPDYEGTHVPADPVFYQLDKTHNLILVTKTDFEGIVKKKRKALILKAKGDSNQLIAFEHRTSEGNRNIMTYDTKTGEIGQLTFYRMTDDHSPSWTPDGRYILYISSSRIDFGVVRTIHMVDPMTKHIRSLSPITHWQCGYASMSPDGKKIAAFTHKYIEIRDAYGNVSELEVKWDNYLWIKSFYPRWSPDGKKILFSLEEVEGELANIFTIDLNGRMKRLTDRKYGMNLNPDWNLNGTISFCRSSDSKPFTYEMIQCDQDCNSQAKLPINCMENRLLENGQFIIGDSNRIHLGYNELTEKDMYLDGSSPCIQPMFCSNETEKNVSKFWQNASEAYVDSYYRQHNINPPN